MVFGVSTLGYIQTTQSLILDYDINIRSLKRRDEVFDAGALGNFSLAGFEMVRIEFNVRTSVRLLAFFTTWSLSILIANSVQTLDRHVMSYIITYYLPSGLFVVVSWFSFLIPPDIVPGKHSQIQPNLGRALLSPT